MGRLLIAIVFVFGTLGCSMLAKMVADKPKVTLKAISFSELSLSKVELSFIAEVENPNSFELGLDEINYEVFMLNKVIGKGIFKEEFRVAAGQKASLEVPFSLDTKAALEVAKSYFSQGEGLKARIEGTMDFVTPVGNYSQSFNETKTLLKKRSF